MKCNACGYTEKDNSHDEVIESNPNINIELKSEDFIHIKGGKFFIINEYSNIEEIKLFGCPRCNTVMFKKWYE